MDNVEEVMQALFIGIALATVLLLTSRYREAIELFGECVVLLKENSTKISDEKWSKLCALVYHRLFDLYCFVGDYTNAIQSGEAFCIHCEMEDFGYENTAAFFEKLGDSYQFTGEQVKAKERYEAAFGMYFMITSMLNSYGTSVIKPKERLKKMLVLTTKIGDKEREGWLLNQLGELALSHCDYSKAEDCFQKELAIWRENGHRKKEGWALRCLGNLYRTMEEYQQAEQHYEEAIAILEDGGEIKKLGEGYSEFGRLCKTLREFQKAKILLKKALKISVKSGNKEDEMLDYRHLAGVHASMGEYDEAKECYQKALVVSSELNNRKGEASTYSDLAVFYREIYDFEKAEAYCKKALEIYKQVGDLLNEGYENRELGDLYCFLCKYYEGIKRHEKALAIKKQIGDRRGEADSCCDLAKVYQSLGDYSKAKDFYEQALAISKETNHLRGQGVDYGNLGTICQLLGDYDTAYEHHKKALEIRLRTGHIEGLPAAYNHLGGVFQHLGEYVKAGKSYKHAVSAAKKIGDRRSEATILSSLASLESTIGEHEKAARYYKEALQISKEVSDIKLEAETHDNLGIVYQYLGDFTSAKKCLQKSLAMMTRIGSRGAEGNAFVNLGVLHFSLGEFTQSRKCYERALKILRETGHKKGEMTTNIMLGSLHFSQNKIQNALDCFKKALGICEQMGDLYGKSMSYCNIAMVYMVQQDIPKSLYYLSASINSLEEMRLSIGESEYYKIGFADQNAAPYQLMVSVLLELGCTNKALSISELARARSLAELMASQYSCQPLPRFDPNRWIDFTNVIQKKSCTCLSFSFVHGNLLCWIIKSGRVEVVTIKDLTTATRPKGASAQEFLESLADLSYRIFLRLQGEGCEDRSLFLWDEQSETRSPSKSEEGPPTSRAPKQKEEDDKQPVTLKDLYKLIITPVEKFLKGSEIIVIPDRSLYRVPFTALIGESEEYLSEKFRIRFIPSLTTLKLIQDSPANYHSQTGALIVGDPDVGLTGLDPLPFARKEAEMIGQLLRVPPLTGKKATKQSVLQKIHSVSLIHIAAHGNADRGDIALAPAQNVKDEPKKEDFVLTMSDISKNQLRAKLVVLSCCHSARGQIKAEGVVGIARAFLGSGARSVLVSLWAVDDIATMQFMKQFYGHLVRGKSASQSLHETMKWMRGNPEFSDVRKWAPFMLIGDDVSFDFKK